jgi:hypothetical protein
MEKPLRAIKKKPRGWTRQGEGDHHYAYCKSCRQWFDVRELEALLYHERPDHPPITHDG